MKEQNATPDYLVGKWFHSVVNEMVSWQGHIRSMVAPGNYAVQLFSWLDGSPTEQRIVNVNDMSAWLFYDSNDQMIAAWENRLCCRNEAIQKKRDAKETAA